MLTLVALSYGLSPKSLYAAEQDDVPNIIVTGRRVIDNNSLVSSKTKLPISELPISVERLDAGTISATGSTSLDSLLSAASSAVPTATEGSAVSEILLRGFSDAPIFRNGINDSAGLLTPRSLANVERIEVLKGPYGALYGPGEPGGSINFITKRPLPERVTEIQFGLGAFSDFSLQFDTTGPITNNANIAYRIIGRREEADSFRDFVKHSRKFLNPMLSWTPTARQRFDLSFEYVSDTRPLDTGIIAIGNRTINDDERFFGEPGDGDTRLDGYTFQFSSKTSIADSWALDISLSGQKSIIRGALVEPDDLEVRNKRLVLNRAATVTDSVAENLVMQAEVSGEALVWALPNHFVFGTSATGINENNLFRESDTDADSYALDILTPQYGRPAPPLAVARNSSEQTRQISFYAQDVVEYGDRWRFLVGLRFDHIDQSGSDTTATSRFNQTSDEVSPRVGIVYKASNSWSWFTSYSRSIDPNEGLRPDGSALAPTEAEALEAGLKWQSQKYHVSIDASAYMIRQANVTTDAPGNPGFEIQTGEQESLGFDFEMRTELSTWLSLSARYNFVDAQILNDGAISNGTTPLNVAKHHFGALGIARASLLKADDLTLALSLNYYSDRQGSLEPDELQFKLPGYFKGDFFLSWALSEKLSIEFGVENFLNKEYTQASQSDSLHLIPGKPIAARAQIILSF